MRTILTDAVPGALALVVLPLAALLFVAQAFAGDRSMGTEGFLLERPVSRGRIWCVRLAASWGSLVLVAALNAGIWALWYAVSGTSASRGWSQPLEMFVAGGLLTLVAAICGVLASSLLSSPLLAILAAALFAALPAAASWGLTTLFPYARWEGRPLGHAVPWILVPLYLIVSFVASSVGEPAGRGRIPRSLGSLALSLIVVAFGFVTTAQGVLRWESTRPSPDGILRPSPAGERALVFAMGVGEGRSVWLVDTVSGRILEHFPAPVLDSLWKADGSAFALVTKSGPLGSVGRARVSVFDAQGEPRGVPFYRESGDHDALWWAGDRLIIREDEGTRGKLIVFVPGKGEVARMNPTLPSRAWSYAGTLWDGSDAIAQIIPGTQMPPEPIEDPSPPQKAGDQDRSRVAYGLFRADLERGRIEDAPLLVERGFPLSAPWRLSPNGRWWVGDVPRDAPMEMIELATGRRVPRSRGGLPDDPKRFFLTHEGDGTSLVQEGPEREPKTLRSWTQTFVTLTRWSQDRYLLIQVEGQGAMVGGSSVRSQDMLFDVESETWTDLGVPVWQDSAPDSPTQEPRRYLRQWVGPHTLARSSTDRLALEDVGSIGTLRYVVGKP